MAASFFDPRHDSLSGRRWRWTTPYQRVALAVTLLVAGFACCVAGLALTSMQVGIPGVLMLVPGAWATRVYVGVMWWGEEPLSRPDVFFEQVDDA